MNTLNKISLILNEIIWVTEIGDTIFNQLVEIQSKELKKHKWFKLEEVYSPTMSKLLVEGTVEAVLQAHPSAEIKKGHVRVSKSYFNKNSKVS